MCDRNTVDKLPSFIWGFMYVGALHDLNLVDSINVPSPSPRLALITISFRKRDKGLSVMVMTL